MKSVLFIIGLILFSSKNFLYGQSYIVEYFGKESGLLDRNITSIQQDNLGYIWLGTLNGSLYRYDGYNFVLFNKYLNLQPSSPIYSIGKTQDGNLWICSDGITVINPNTLESKVYYSGADLYGKGSNQQNLFFSFLRTEKNDIWLNSSSGVYVVRNNNIQQLEVVKSEHPLQSDIQDLLLDEKNNIWLCTLRNIYKIENGRLKEKSISKNFKKGNHLIFPCVNIKNQLIGYYIEALNSRYSLDDNLLKDDKSLNNVVNWNFIRKHYTDLDNKLKTLADNKHQRWFTSYTSTDSTVWIGTYAGLFKFTPKNAMFSSFPSLSNYSIRTIFEDKQTSNLYFGTYNGLVMENLKSNQTSTITNRLAYKIILKKDNRILVMTEVEGLEWWNLKTGEVKKIFPKSHGISKSTATYLENDTLLFSFKCKIYSYDVRNENLNSQIIDMSNMIDSINGNIYTIFKNKKQQLWISTDRGVGCMDTRGIGISQPCLKSPYFTEDVFITSFYEDNADNFWMTSKNYGVFKINLKQNLVERICQKDGLANEEAYAILSKDGGRTLWISTANGLSYFDTQKNQFKNYFENDGLANNEFNRGAFLSASDGTFYFGGINGVTYFKPENIKKDSIAFLPMLTRYAIYNIDGNIKTYSYFGTLQDNIVLSPKDNIIEFQVSCSDYVDLTKRTYQFFLDGFDKDWSSTANGSNSIRYMNLPAGNYTLNIKAIGGLGEWSENNLHVNIKVIQPFYKSLWFRALLAVLFIGLVYGVFKYRLVQIKRYNDIRLSIGSNLHDELGGTLYAINFTANSLLQEKYSESGKLDTLISLCQKAYKNMSEIIWAINPDNQEFSKLKQKMDDEAMSILAQYYSKTYFEWNNINLKSKVRLDIAHHILMIYKEALVNIVKHTVPTSIVIKLNNGQFFDMEITNSFTIRNLQPLSSGNGIYNMKNRASKIKAKLEVESTENKYQVRLSLKEKL